MQIEISTVHNSVTGWEVSIVHSTAWWRDILRWIVGSTVNTVIVARTAI